MIRDYEPRDLGAVKKIYKAQGFDYALPDLSSPLVLVRKVREVDGRVVAAMFLRITAETFLLVQGSPVEKGRAIAELQPEVDREAWQKGLADYVCVIPPEIAESFAPVLERMGWSHDRDWPMWSRTAEDPEGPRGAGIDAERGQPGQ
jgi:hypothetical protein